MRTLARLFTVVAFATAATVAFAQPAPTTEGPRQAGFLKHWGLTDDQVQQVSDLLAKSRLALVPERAQLKVLNAQIELALTAPSPDLKAVNAMVDKKAQLRADTEKQQLAVAAQVHQIVGDQIFYRLRAHLFGHRHWKQGWNHRFGPEVRPSVPSPQPENP